MTLKMAAVVGNGVEAVRKQTCVEQL
jgi:hypothetical protein